MRHYSVQVTPGQYRGELRNILGMNNLPMVVNKIMLEPQKKLFDDLHIAYLRHHDAAMENKGQNIIDVSRLFPLFKLDENDPENYDFAQTDDYLSVTADSDAEIEFRLGESIEPSGFYRRVTPPSDPEKWARICVNIIRHYRDGWGNGMHLNITRASIWEEPDNRPSLMNAPFEKYCELFVASYRALKQAFPELKVGGPNTMASDSFGQMEIFLDYCEKNGVRPDFLGITTYPKDIDFLPDLVKRLRAACEKHGFSDVPVTIAEWHLSPLSWDNIVLRDPVLSGFSDADAAGYSASTLIRLMDLPVDAAYYYAWCSGNFSAVYTLDGTCRPLASYFGMKYFTDTVRCEKRLAVTTDADPEVDFLAAETRDGRIRLLVSCYGSCAFDMKISVPDARKAAVKGFVNEIVNYKPDEPTELPLTDGVCRLELARGGSGLWLLEFEC